ncbi:MAG: N-acetylmuramoyl-L-alanine amidase [Lachnospiraceae bacterium]|nr:N-acetylmuramoyl-L-alanine amidase [Lachnospiraceae bacterium]
MQSSVRKKKGEIMLWEIAVSGGRSESARRARYRPVMSRPTRQSEQYIRRRKARRRRAYFYRALAFAMLISVVMFIMLLAGFVLRFVHGVRTKENIIQTVQNFIFNDIGKERVEKPEMVVDLLNVNDYSRPGTDIEDIKNIFVHYTANPKTSAAQNRSYFANLEQTHERSASAHLIIGYEGEIIQCIPLEEQAYAVKTRNNDSISIECCYLEENGKFTQETYDSLVHLLAWLVQEYNLECTDILRHYDCGGKKCPLYYVEHEDSWEKLLADVEAYSSMK